MAGAKDAGLHAHLDTQTPIPGIETSVTEQETDDNDKESE